MLSSDSRVRSWVFPVVALIALCFGFLIGARDPLIDRGRLYAFEDPFLVGRWTGQVTTIFDGTPSSIFLDRGWSKPFLSTDPEQSGTLVNVIGNRSRIIAVAPRGHSLELVLHCKALAADTPLSMYIEIGNQRSPIQTLGHSWQSVRFPLGISAIPGSLLEVWLNVVTKGATPSEAPIPRRERPQNLTCSRITLASTTFVGEPTPAKSLTSPARLSLVPNLSIGTNLSYPIPGRTSVYLDLRGLQLPDRCLVTARLDVPASRRSELAFQSRDRSVDYLRNTSSSPAELLLTLQQKRPAACSGISIPWSSLRKAIRLSNTPSSKSKRQQPNVFLYVVDTLRADAITPAITPNLHRFAQNAVRWHEAYSPSSWTLPSMTSLLTGLLPARHGVLQWNQRLRTEDPQTLAEALRHRGYRTVAISHSWIVSHEYGLNRGFDDFFFSDHLSGRNLRSQEARGLLRSWLLNNLSSNQPIFALIHTVDPHAPYSPPSGPLAGTYDPSRPTAIGDIVRSSELRQYRTEYSSADVDKIRALYLAEVAYTDIQFERFLDLLRAFNLYDSAMIIVTSDHGEEFREHGYFEHGKNVFPETTRVPLIIRLPHGQHAGRSIYSAVTTLDVPTTIAAVASADLTPTDGTDLLKNLAASSSRPSSSTIFLDLIPNAAEQDLPRRLRAAIIGHQACLLEHLSSQQQARLRFFLIRDAWMPQAALPGDVDQSRCVRALQMLLRSDPSPNSSAEEWEPERHLKEALQALGYLR